MNNMNFICPTCKRPTHPDDNEIIEHLAKEKDRYRDILGERTKELEHTRKALDVAKDAIDVISLKYHKDTPSIFLIKYAQNAKAEITALEQKDR